MLGRRTLSTLIVLLIAGGAAWASVHLDTPAPMIALSVLVLLLSFLETAAFVQKRYAVKALLFLSCASTFVGLTFLTAAPSTPTQESFVVMPLDAILATCAGVILFFAANALCWSRVDYRSSAAEVGWFYVVFVYYGILAPVILRVLIFPQYVVWDASRGPLASPDHSVAAGIYFFLGAILTAKFTDIGAYLGGSLLGKRLFAGKKMAPRISPGKTMAGLLFGIATSVVAGWALLYFNPFGKFHPMVLLLFGPVTGILTVGGDLMESFFKRSFSLKDSGGVLPGIGGVFDLTDSLFWAMPGAYMLLLLNFRLV